MRRVTILIPQETMVNDNFSAWRITCQDGWLSNRLFEQTFVQRVHAI